jgi:DNA-binding SARP family transcriptional activator/tRNA A-37 threonylcarbamoyl transferase component Bud32
MSAKVPVTFKVPVTYRGGSDMTKLSLSLLGAFRAALNGKILTGFRTNKAQALLIYLVVEPEPQRREHLMTLLWPGMPERSARHNLRQILYHLRQAIPDLSSESDKQTAVSFLLTNRQTIQLNPTAVVMVDVHQFEEQLKRTQTHNHVDLFICHSCRQTLEQAVGLYNGDFLSDFYLDDSNDFEEWAEIKRQSYRRQALDALETLTTIHTRQTAYPEAQGFAQRQLEIDNLRESAYRQLMEIYALNGRREEALALYESCRRLLAEELGMAPTVRTTAMYEKIVAGDLRFDAPEQRGVRGFELKEEIGSGAYGTIYRAVPSAIGRDVAVKVIRRRYANDPEFIRRFESEAQTIARLEHPYIVPLYDYWREPDGAYLVMRLLRGGSLLSALENGPLAPDSTVTILSQLASALTTAHRQGIVHRDIKPANILFDEANNAYLSDFGIAKDLGHDLGLTAAGAMIGTPDYISPEQLTGQEVTP